MGERSSKRDQDEQSDLASLVEFIARGLVESPDEVEVDEVDDGILEMRVAPNDRGTVIGRNGRTANAFRTVLAASAGAQDCGDIRLKIVDDR